MVSRFLHFATFKLDDFFCPGEKTIGRRSACTPILLGQEETTVIFAGDGAYY